MPGSHARTQEQAIASLLHPSASYGVVGSHLCNIAGNATTLQVLASQVLDELDAKVSMLHDADLEPGYDAEITEQSRAQANRVFLSLADNLDQQHYTLKHDAARALVQDLQRTLMDMPPGWREIAVKQGVLPLWHEAIAKAGAIEKIILWSARQDHEWVEWFASNMDPGFLDDPGRMDAMLSGINAIPARGKAKNQAIAAAQPWVQAILRSSPKALSHLHAVAVHEATHAEPTRAMAYLAGNGWTADPSCAAWPDVLTLDGRLPSQGILLSSSVRDYLDQHMDTIAITWPHMVVLPPGPIDARSSINACSGVSLWHLLEHIAPDDRSVLSSRLQSHAMKLQTNLALFQSQPLRF